MNGSVLEAGLLQELIPQATFFQDLLRVGEAVRRSRLKPMVTGFKD